MLRRRRLHGNRRRRHYQPPAPPPRWAQPRIWTTMRSGVVGLLRATWGEWETLLGDLGICLLSDEVEGGGCTRENVLTTECLVLNLDGSRSRRGPFRCVCRYLPRGLRAEGVVLTWSLYFFLRSFLPARIIISSQTHASLFPYFNPGLFALHSCDPCQSSSSSHPLPCAEQHIPPKNHNLFQVRHPYAVFNNINLLNRGGQGHRR